MSQTAIAFQSHRGVSLDGVVAMPRGSPRPCPGVVLCHGHPLFGESMEAPLVVAMAQGLAARGMASLRFNFPMANGQQVPGPEELCGDAVEALRVMEAMRGVRGSRLAVVGHSLGAAAILYALKDLKKARTLVLLSPPLSAVHRAPLDKDKRPKLVVAGERDKIVPFLELAATVQGGKGVTFQAVPGSDHGYARREGQVAALVSGYLAQALLP